MTNWRGRHAKEAENLAFSGGKCWWNALKLSWGNPSPLAHHFHQASLSGSSGAMCYHAKPYCPGQRLLGPVRGWTKCKVRVGVCLRSKQNASMTVGNSRPWLQSKVKCDQDYCVCYCWWQPLGLHSCGLPSLTPAEVDLDCLVSLQLDCQDLVCLLLLLLRLIWTVFSRYCWGTRSWQSSCSETRQTRSWQSSCPPSPVGHVLSIPAAKWAALTMKLCTQHCAWVSYVHVPHQNSTSKCPSVAHEVWSCPWLIFTPRTVCPDMEGCRAKLWIACFQFHLTTVLQLINWKVTTQVRLNF